MLHPIDMQPDKALGAYLTGNVFVGEGTARTAVPVYSDWERPTNKLPDDFVVVYINGSLEGVGMDTPFAKGNIIVSLYCKMNDDGSVKDKRVKKILRQFDLLIDKKLTGGYYFEYEAQQFITPTTPNQTTGYSVTSLNLRWTTTSELNQ